MYVLTGTCNCMVTFCCKSSVGHSSLAQFVIDDITGVTMLLFESLGGSNEDRLRNIIEPIRTIGITDEVDKITNCNIKQTRLRDLRP